MPRPVNLPRGPKTTETFEATLKFLGFYPVQRGVRTMNYVDVSTGLLYSLSNTQIERLVMRGQLRPILQGTWGWLTQGDSDVIKPLNLTYAGETIPKQLT